MQQGIGGALHRTRCGHLLIGDSLLARRHISLTLSPELYYIGPNVILMDWLNKSEAKVSGRDL